MVPGHPPAPQIKRLGVHPLCWHCGCQPLPITLCLLLSSGGVRPPDPWGNPPLGVWLCFGEVDGGSGGPGTNVGVGGGLWGKVGGGGGQARMEGQCWGDLGIWEGNFHLLGAARVGRAW